MEDFFCWQVKVFAKGPGASRAAEVGRENPGRTIKAFKRVEFSKLPYRKDWCG